MNKKLGNVFITLGLLLFAAALALTIYNLWGERQAGSTSQDMLAQIEEQIAENESELAAFNADSSDKIPDYVRNPEMEMPTEIINEIPCIGTLEIPALGLSLPIISEWSYPKLQCAPCRYTGSAYQNNMIIAAHNYSTHFGGLSSLHQGNEVIFTDADGNVFNYEVVETEVLEPTAIEEMEAGEWDLTLFTCTLGGQSRVTVRCERTDEPNYPVSFAESFPAEDL